MVQRDKGDPRTASEVATTTTQLETSQLRDINSLDDALRVLSDAGIAPRAASEEMGDGFELLDDKEKSRLVGVHFLVLSATEAPGDFGKTFVTLRVITKNGEKLILNDGSTGIRDQVVAHEAEHGAGSIVGMHFENGLRASNYWYCEQCRNIGKKQADACPECSHSPLSPATTYYLDTSK